MTRRKLITLLGGLIAAPVAHPFVARADRTRRIGLLINLRSDDPEGQNRLMAFVQALQKFGWTEGSNIHIDLRWASDDADLSRRYAEELVAPGNLMRFSRAFGIGLRRRMRSVRWHGRITSTSRAPAKPASKPRRSAIKDAGAAGSPEQRCVCRRTAPG